MVLLEGFELDFTVRLGLGGAALVDDDTWVASCRTVAEDVAAGSTVDVVGVIVADWSFVTCTVLVFCVFVDGVVELGACPRP